MLTEGAPRKPPAFNVALKRWHDALDGLSWRPLDESGGERERVDESFVCMGGFSPRCSPFQFSHRVKTLVKQRVVNRVQVASPAP